MGIFANAYGPSKECHLPYFTCIHYGDGWGIWEGKDGWGGLAKGGLEDKGIGIGII